MTGVLLFFLFGCDDSVSKERYMNNESDTLAMIILAAGLGKRMKSSKAKVLHEVLGRPMVHYVLETAVHFAEKNVYVIVGYQSDVVRAAIEAHFTVHYVHQEKQLGTGHAVSCAMPHLAPEVSQVVILCGDTPMVSRQTIASLIRSHRQMHNDLTLLAVHMANPAGYGRILMTENLQVSGIVEEADATAEQRGIKMVNAGIYCIDRSFLEDALGSLKNDNAQQEWYLTDIVEIGFKKQKAVSAVVCEMPAS